MLVAEHTNIEDEIAEMASHAVWKNLERSMHELTLTKSTFPFRMMMRTRFNPTPLIRPLQRVLKEYEY
jgi:hypothetical protein